MNPLKLRYKIVLISVLFLFSACRDDGEKIDKLTSITPSPGYEYQLGLGYGFLDKEVRVTIDGVEVLSQIGTKEIEDFAQMQGTYMLTSGYSQNKEISVSVIVDGDQPFTQIINLSTGIYIHIYFEDTGLHIFTTKVLILE